MFTEQKHKLAERDDSDEESQIDSCDDNEEEEEDYGECLSVATLFYKHKGYKHIEAQNSPKVKHILSMRCV